MPVQVPEHDEETLLAAVFEAPDDDGPRLGYADALTLRGDPRGEFIVLQIQASSRGKPRAEFLHVKARRRQQKLIDTHGRSWLGELAPILRSPRFERGFLAACEVDLSDLERVTMLAGHPMWSTVRELAGSARIALHPVMKSLRVLEFDPGAAAVWEQLPDAWRDLLEGPTRRIETLRYVGPWHDKRRQHSAAAWFSRSPASYAHELTALGHCTALPQLRSLTVRGDLVAIVPSLLTAPIARRLDTLGFVHRPTRPVPAAVFAVFARALREASVATLRGTFGDDDNPTEATAERGADGYERIAIRVGPLDKHDRSQHASSDHSELWSHHLATETIAILQALPSSVAELQITAREGFVDDARARVRAFAETLALRVCEVE